MILYGIFFSEYEKGIEAVNFGTRILTDFN